MQLAHQLAQLLSRGSLLRKLFPKGFGSLQNLAFRLLEAWRNSPLTPRLLRCCLLWRFQYRFDSS
jgi:hypothetical protein